MPETRPSAVSLERARPAVPIKAAALLQARSILNVDAETSHEDVDSCLTEALVIHASHDLRLDPILLPDPGPDEV